MRAKDMPPQPGDDTPVNKDRPDITWGHLFGRKKSPETVECARCRGEGEIYKGNDGYGEISYTCPDCDGKKVVPVKKPS